MLAGGTGGAKLATAIQGKLPPGQLTVIANTADDDEFWGHLVSPDVDAVIYRLAGVFNETAGYGVKDDTFHVLDALARLGEPVWFRIGDRDFATHLLRTEMLGRGCTLTECALALCARFGLSARVLPMTNERVRTRFVTDRGEFSFQEYFVRERLSPPLRGIEFAGIDSARPTHEVIAALEEADLVIIGPSNPLISIAPILEVIGAHIPRERAVAITPIVRGVALKGPTVEMMRAVGTQPTPVAIALMYRAKVASFVLDIRDRELAGKVSDLGLRALVFDTVMADGGEALAGAVLEAFT
ncbi:MAG: 2-phospho-L-lactate transferase [Candidatus Dormibacteraceae bacterium]